MRTGKIRNSEKIRKISHFTLSPHYNNVIVYNVITPSLNCYLKIKGGGYVQNDDDMLFIKSFSHSRTKEERVIFAFPTVKLCNVRSHSQTRYRM